MAGTELFNQKAMLALIGSFAVVHGSLRINCTDVVLTEERQRVVTVKSIIQALPGIIECSCVCRGIF